MSIVNGIPNQLDGYKVIKLGDPDSDWGKRPLEKWSKDKNRYSLDDAKNRRMVRNHLSEGKAIGMPLVDGLQCIDVESHALENDVLIKVIDKLPRTFTVMSGSGGLHFYYLVEGYDEQKAIYDGDEHIADLKASGKGYCVIPPSPHTDGRYKVHRDREIAEVSEAEFRTVLSDLGIRSVEEVIKGVLNEKKKNLNVPKSKNYSGDGELDKESIKELLPPLDSFFGGDEGKRKPHPVHSSSSGKNYHVKGPDDSICSRHNKSIDKLYAYGLLNGYIDECGDKMVTGKEFVDMLKEIKEEYG